MKINENNWRVKYNEYNERIWRIQNENKKNGRIDKLIQWNGCIVNFKNLKHDYVIVSCNKLFSYGHKSRCKNFIIFLTVLMFLRYSDTHKTMKWTTLKQYVFEANSSNRTMKKNLLSVMGLYCTLHNFCVFKFTELNPCYTVSL